MTLKKNKTTEGGKILPTVSSKKKVFVWSLPTRLFHWLLVSALITSAGTSYYENLMNIHMSLGFIALFLVFWRIYYGFHGPLFSRFESFVFPLHRVKSYLRDVSRLDPPEYVGHNPPHGWIIIAFFSVVFLSMVTGAVVLYGEENEGMFAGLFSYSTGEFSKEIHEGLALLLGVMIFFHLSGVFLDSILHNTNLVKAMITGRKYCGVNAINPETGRKQPPDTRTKGRLWLATSYLLTGGIFYSTNFAASPTQEFSKAGEGFEIWKTECSDCHELFHPLLLPGRSWDEMVGGLETHFGEDASIDKESEKPLRRFLNTYSAENSDTEAAFKIRSSLDANETVIRITNTRYWKKKHAEIGGEIYERRAIKSKTHCKACHSDALSGGYKDRMITVPTA